MGFPWQLHFDVAFDVDPGDEPGGGDWTDLSARLRSGPGITIVEGAGRLSGGNGGTCDLTLDNTDRAIDPTNSDATTGPSALNLVPMRHARLRATVVDLDDIATVHPLFRGFVKAWPPVWSPVDSEVRVSLVDLMAWLGLQDADLDLPRQMSHERIAAILDAGGVPAGLRDIGIGVVELEPFEQVSANLLRTLQDTAEAEIGDLYVAPDGKVTFRSRHARFAQTPAAEFGVGVVGTAAATPVWDTDWITNISRVELADGRVFEMIDDDSVLAYGPRNAPSRDLSLRAAEAEAVGQWEIVRFSQPRLWLDDVTAHGHVGGVLAALLPVRVGQLITTHHTPPAGAAVDVAGCVEGRRHNIGTGFWTITFDLSPDFGEGPWLTLDDPVLGLLDLDNKLAP